MNHNKAAKRNKYQQHTITPAGTQLPPQAIDAEEAVIGALLLQGHKTDQVYCILPQADCFYNDAHRTIYAAILRLYHAGKSIDLVTVAAELNNCNELLQAGGPQYLGKLNYGIAGSTHIEAHARIVMEKRIQRQLIQASGSIIDDAYHGGDAFEMLDAAAEQINAISGNTARAGFKHISAVVMDTMKAIDLLKQNNSDLTGITSGYEPLDRFTYGWQPQDLIIIAARPSVGKTAFVLNLALNAAMAAKPTPVGFFSLEMGEQKLATRCISCLSQLPMDKLKRGRFTDAEQRVYTEGANKLAALPIYIDDTGGLNIYELRSKARKMVRNDKVGLIIIDYLQLMQGMDNGRNSNRENEVAKISRDLKSLAKELNIPIIALSQLNRAVETRKEHKGEPFLSDLRESGAIEQDADSVLFLWREDYQNAEGITLSSNDVQLKIAKNRDGMTEKLGLKVDLQIQRFFDIEGWERYPLAP